MWRNMLIGYDTNSGILIQIEKFSNFSQNILTNTNGILFLLFDNRKVKLLHASLGDLSFLNLLSSRTRSLNSLILKCSPKSTGDELAASIRNPSYRNSLSSFNCAA